MRTSDWRGLRVLVTGHTGFKGAWLTMLLRRAGAEVAGFSLDPEPGALFTSARVYRDLAWDGRGDIRDADAVADAWREADPDVVFHLAAESLVRRAHRSPVETVETNIMGTTHLLESARRQRFAGPIVVVTSDKVYDNDGRSTGYDPGDRLGGSEPYGASKAACELIARTWREAYGLRIATARAGNVIGGGDIAEDRLLPDCLRAWRAGEPVEIRHPEATRPWQHVLDPLQAYLELAGALARSEAFATGWNIGPVEAAWSVREVLDHAAGHWPGARWETRLQPGAPAESKRLDLDIRQSLEQLGWRPRWSTAEAIRRTIRWEADVYAGMDPRARCEADLEAHAWRALPLRRAS